MLQSWHRGAGAFAALFLIVLAGTGLLLMNADGLNLAHHHVRSAWLLDWYGIRPPPPATTFSLGQRWVTQLGSRVYLDEQEIPGLHGALLGTAGTGDGEWLVVTGDMLVYLTDDGQVAERLGPEAGLPDALRAVGTTPDGTLVLQTAATRLRFDPVAGRFLPMEAAANVHWQAPADPPDALLEALGRAYRGEGLPLERVLLDLHSGRLFGQPGVWLVNLASILLLFLAGSGLWMWWRRRRLRRR